MSETATNEPFPAPFECPVARVERDWIDYNGHLNMAYYHVLFDRALDAAYDALGIGEGYLDETGCSHFTLEVHVGYQREVRLEDPLRITWQLIAHDHKRLHFFEAMHHAEEGWLAATSEQLAIHVDMGTRRSAPFPDAVAARLAEVQRRHAALETPAQAGRRIGLSQ